MDLPGIGLQDGAHVMGIEPLEDEVAQAGGHPEGGKSGLGNARAVPGHGVSKLGERPEIFKGHGLDRHFGHKVGAETDWVFQAVDALRHGSPPNAANRQAAAQWWSA